MSINDWLVNKHYVNDVKPNAKVDQRTHLDNVVGAIIAHHNGAFFIFRGTGSGRRARTTRTFKANEVVVIICDASTTNNV